MAPPNRCRRGEVTGGFFAVMGTPPLLGRVITAADDPMGSRDVVVLSHALWVRRFGANPAIIGQPVVIDGVSREVIGVMPAGFQFPLRSEMWMPLRFSARDLETQRGAHYIEVIGRLKAGVTHRALARGHARDRARGWRADFPRTNRDTTRVGAAAARVDGQERSSVDVRAARRGRAGAADRLRQRGRPGADSCARPRPRAGGARRDGRGPHRAGACVVRREPHARSRRRRRRPACWRIGRRPRSRRSIRRSACRCSIRRGSIRS